jgi:hypothetical protein
MRGQTVLDIEEEAKRVLRLGAESGATVRLLGGLAVARHRHRPIPPNLQRSFGDIDIVVRRGHDRVLRKALEAGGYVPNRAFNSLRGDRRLMYFDEANARQLDVFIGAFRMCHVLELDDRLRFHPATLSPADLLLTKLQIIEVNAKDLIDALVLLHGHDLGDEGAGDVIGVDRLVDVTSRDWGWYTTITDNLVKVHAAANELLLDGGRDDILLSIEALAAALARAPKSLGWKLRSTVGRRMTWYELPEEVGTKTHG